MALCLMTSSALFADDITVKWGGKASAKWQQWEEDGWMNVKAVGSLLAEKDNAWLDLQVKITAVDASTNFSKVYVDIDKALLGYSMRPCEQAEFFLEAGRSKMKYLFDSKIQHNSPFNGAHFSLAFGDFCIHGGPHIIDTSRKHFGAVAEATYQFNMVPLEIRYSVSHWKPAYDFTTSQVTAVYKPSVSIPTSIYGAYIRNHQTNYHAGAYYVGLTLGNIQVAHDWMFDINYQHTGDFAVHWADDKGIGTGIQAKTTYAFTDNLHGHLKYTHGDFNVGEVGLTYSW